jgi:hypothetical protein
MNIIIVGAQIIVLIAFLLTLLPRNTDTAP